MRVSDLMIPTGPMSSATTLRDAAIGMHESGVDALPVTDGRGRVGLVTANAVAYAAAGGRCDPARTSARGVMAKDCCRVHADDDLDTALGAMTTRRARRSVVLDGADRAIGILALGDCAAGSGLPTSRAGSIERFLDGDRVERGWRRLGAGRQRSPSAQPAPRPRTGAPLPLDAFVEAYLDYHG